MASASLPTQVESALVRTALALPEGVQRTLGGRPIEIDGQRLSAESQLLVRMRGLTPRREYDDLGVEEARKVLDHDALTVRGRMRPIAEARELDVAGLRARLYVPTEDGGALLVFFHGGGGVLGSLDSHESPCRFLAAEGGVRVLSIDYRLAPEAKFPAAIEDGLAAFEWARENAGDRVAVGGDSAGGNIAAVVAQLASPKPALALLIYPVCDYSKKHESYRLFGEGFFLTARNMDWYRDHYLPDAEAALDPRASPLLAEDLSAMPRTYLAAAGFDPLRDEALAYGRRLAEAGVDVTVALHEGLIHGYANMSGVGRTSAAAMKEAAEVLKTL
jgi:acetyl esterase